MPDIWASLTDAPRVEGNLPGNARVQLTNGEAHCNSRILEESEDAQRRYQEAP